MFVSYYSFFQTNNKSECLEKGYNWTNAQITFDNVIAGYLSLFQIVSYYHQYHQQHHHHHNHQHYFRNLV